MLSQKTTVLASLLLTACATGPDYHPAVVPPAAAAPFIGAAASDLFTAAQPQGDWWRLYDDPVLDRLVRDALAGNADLRVAMARLAKAQALVREERGARELQVALDGSSQYGRVPGAARAAGQREDLQVGLGLSVAYEADLFGRLSRGVEAARGDAAATAFDADAVRVSIVSRTVGAYADAVSLAERIAVAQRIVQLLDRSLALTERRHRLGLANGLDTSRIEALRDQRRAEIPLLEVDRQTALLQLATLTGRAPRELPAEVATRTTSLRLRQVLPVGDGAMLLSRRPDVRAAERRLAASSARIGVATADLYPRITLGGAVGSSGAGIGNLFGANPLTFLLGPLIHWTANRSAARARVAGARADAQAALANFDGTILQALQETETALSAYRQSLVRQDALRSARDAAEKAATITRARQREGDISSLELLDAERTSADAQATLADADARIAQRQVDLFRAMGGGWTDWRDSDGSQSNTRPPTAH